MSLRQTAMPEPDLRFAVPAHAIWTNTMPDRLTICEYDDLPSTEDFNFNGIAFRHVTEDIGDGRRAVLVRHHFEFLEDGGFYKTYNPNASYMNCKEDAAKFILEKFLLEDDDSKFGVFKDA